MPPGFHLVAALLLGITAGFCEEVLFRAFLMTEFANQLQKAGYSACDRTSAKIIKWRVGNWGKDTLST